MADATKQASQDVRQKFAQMREEIRKLSNSLSDIELQHSEYTIALGALEKLPGERKCYRLVGHALVEHTVADVRPTLSQRKDQLEKLQKGFNDKLSLLEDASTKFAIENNLVKPVETTTASTAKSGESKDSSSHGVLV